MSAFYLLLSRKEFKKRIKQLYEILEECELCPRKCRVNRLKNEKGFCRVGEKPVVSSYHSHFGEEFPLVGQAGSGTIFFTFCNLACKYCQNYDISHLGLGRQISEPKLAKIMLHLQDSGCSNINLVSPTHQVPFIVKAIFLAKNQGLRIPIVYNTNSYDSVRTLRLLKNIIDIYLPDFKYSNDKIAEKFSLAPKYFSIAKKAITEMFKQVGNLKIKNKVAYQGLLVRHLVLPNNLAGTEKIMHFLAKLSKDIWVNIMDQYQPYFKAHQYSQLARPLLKEELNKAIGITLKAGLKNLL